MQIEYALQAVAAGAPSVGIKGTCMRSHLGHKIVEVRKQRECMNRRIRWRRKRGEGAGEEGEGGGGREGKDVKEGGEEVLQITSAMLLVVFSH